MIENWNAVVKPHSIVWHLGDVAFMPYKHFKNTWRRLNGIKNLVLGNHDNMIIDNREELLQEKLFNSIQNYAELRLRGLPMIVLFHYGQRVWNKSHHGSIHLYGHSHGSLPPFGKSVDAGVDCKEITPEYRPITLDEVLAYMAKREFETVDHHKDGQKRTSIL